MLSIRHDLSGRGDCCIFCGVTAEDLQDNLASPYCSVIRQVSSPVTAIPVAIGILVAVAIFGNILFGWGS